MLNKITEIQKQISSEYPRLSSVKIRKRIMIFLFGKKQELTLWRHLDGDDLVMIAITIRWKKKVYFWKFKKLK